ncbi:MAG: hypothetical protein ACOC16_02130 [Nanoarchaeota archaeon]
MESEKDRFMRSFEDKLKKQLDSKTYSKLKYGTLGDDDEVSVDYEKFRIETLPKSINLYERICDFCEKILKIKPDEKTSNKINQILFKAHLNCSPTGVQSTSIFFSMIILMLGFVLLLITPIIGSGFIFIGLGVYFGLQSIPGMFAKKMQSQANDEVIVAVFYIVAFMRFNSNFELAVNFAANYLNPPLSLDFKRLLWELQNSKYPNIKQAMDKYLESWRDENLEFLEAIYLIETSLYESESVRRISLLDKALDIILQGNYEKMLHFAQELKGKVTTFNMMGIVLPILGLIILPLAASFGDPKSVLEVVVLLYIILIPFMVGYFGFILVFNRPSNINAIKIPKLKKNKQDGQIKFKISSKKKIYLSPKIPAIFILLLFLFIGLIPLIVHYSGMENNLNSNLRSLIPDSKSPFAVFQEYKSIEKDDGSEYSFGPYGVYPGILSLFIPLAFAYSLGYYFRYRYKELIKIRDNTKKLEVQFPSAMFQLGNRINEGIAAELAFGAVADTMKGTQVATFLEQIDSNIKFEGMGVEAAIFDPQKGAILEYPSDLVISSMKILLRAIEKGPEITSQTLMDLSRYLTEMHLSAERMRDLLSESVGSMKAQVNFLAPFISGIVISIVSLVTIIMGTLSNATRELSSGDMGIPNFLGESMPTYLFQSVVGIYLVMLIIILVYVITNLENGNDIIFTKYEMGQKVQSAFLKYTIVVTIGILFFTYIGSKILVSIA